MFDKMGFVNGMPKKPKKIHYHNVVKKDVRKFVAAMSKERQQKWLDAAKVEYADGYDLSELMIQCVI